MAPADSDMDRLFEIHKLISSGNQETGERLATQEEATKTIKEDISRMKNLIYGVLLAVIIALVKSFFPK